MPIPFSHVCDLLEQCSRLCAARKEYHPAVNNWFQRHRALIDAYDTNVAALLSTLLPDKRTDRVYCIQATSLEKIVGRALMLGSSRMRELALYRLPEKCMDLADCVERILLATPNPAQSTHCAVTVEQIDMTLHSLASRIRWSSPKIRKSQISMTHESRGEIEALYLRFSPCEAKWFTRLILKNYEPLIFHSEAIYGLCDAALPFALKILDDFVAAIEAVQHAKTRLLPNSSRKSIVGNSLLSAVKPRIGIKVGRQMWLKARSIKHCLDMGRGPMSVERKVDGEYCQIHVDLSNPQNSIQIFSKSGKDSTEDRKKIHSVIMDSLRQGVSVFSIKQNCILEGELVVYSDREMKIRPFHTIRNHVTRRGRYMQTDQDSPPKSYEHLMLVYFDVLYVDGVSLLSVRQSERRKHLERIVKLIPGRSEIVRHQVIDFGHRLAASHLRKAFAAVIIQREEGLVLKPDDPYFDFTAGRPKFTSSCIKLKKEYIGNFGEIGDFAVVGAGFDPVRAKSYNISNVKWTHFYLGCLNNKEEVVRWAAKPNFTIVCIVEFNETQLKSFITNCVTDSVPLDRNRDTRLQLAPGLDRRPPLSVAFTQPPVVDVCCFSFDKEGNTGFWTPRFPRISKINFDRDFADSITFDELQSMAKDATSVPELEDSQENLLWIARLERADPRGVAADATSQLTASSLATPSPRRRTRSVSELSSPTTQSISRSQPMIGRDATCLNASAIPLKLPQPLKRAHTPHASSSPREPLPEARNGGPSNGIDGKGDAEVPNPKRHRSELLATDQTAYRKPSMGENNSRQPLGNIEGNSSQRSCHRKRSAQATRDNCRVVIDLTSSPVSSQAVIDSATSSITGESVCFHGNDTTIMTIPDIAVFHDPAVVPSDEPAEITTKAKISVCKVAGSQCHLAGSVVALAACLNNKDEVARRLAEHGNHCLLDWQDLLVSLRKLPDSNRKAAILLVDSVGQLRQTRDILEELEECLDRDSTGRRGWVHIYDWRVLDHINTSEEESISSQGFEGFTDPWRRWQVGIL